MLRERHAVGAQSLAPAIELRGVGDVEGAGALLDRAVKVRDPDLEHVERNRFRECVHLLLDDGAAVGGGDVRHAVDRQRGEVDEPQGVRRRRGIGADRIDQIAQELRHPRPEAAAGGDRHLPEGGVEAVSRGVALVDREVAAALHQDFGDTPVEGQRLQDPHPRPGGVGVRGGRGHDHRPRHRHREFGELGVGGKERRGPHRAPGIVDVDRHLFLQRPRRRREGRVAPAVRAAAVPGSGIVRENPLGGADRGADRRARPVVPGPGGAHQGLRGLAGVQVLGC